LIWQEIEIYKDHAFVVCDLSPCNLQIFDLTRLRGVEAEQPWTPDSVFPIPNAHSIDHNPETGHLFVNGSLAIGGGTPVILDITTPKTPVPIGAIADDGYTHDSLCRTYRGPDKDFKGGEICFNFNEDTITVYDVRDPAAPVQLSRVTYDNASYVHSGALTNDHSYLISTDEGDEADHGLRSTLYIWDVRKLSDPKLIGTYVARSGAIDHNVYSGKGDALFHASYTNGFRILDMSKASQGELREVAYFDIMPEADGPDFDGSWAAYPYLPSGNVLVGGMGQGLFIVKPEPAILKRLR
ncbi:MAG: choice-of-anchor B family protein, partial [Actinomycetota bacterium]